MLESMELGNDCKIARTSSQLRASWHKRSLTHPTLCIIWNRVRKAYKTNEDRAYRRTSCYTTLNIRNTFQQQQQQIQTQTLKRKKNQLFSSYELSTHTCIILLFFFFRLFVSRLLGSANWLFKRQTIHIYTYTYAKASTEPSNELLTFKNILLKSAGFFGLLDFLYFITL